jgi:hypothetical protein
VGHTESVGKACQWGRRKCEFSPGRIGVRGCRAGTTTPPGGVRGSTRRTVAGKGAGVGGISAAPAVKNRVSAVQPWCAILGLNQLNRCPVVEPIFLNRARIKRLGGLLAGR